MQQETSWPRLLKAKASVRSLKSKRSFASLTRRDTSQSSTSHGSSQSPAHPSPILGEAPPPVPPIPLRFVTGFPETATEEGSGEEDIAPFLAYEQYAPARKAPTTPTTPTTPGTLQTPTMRTVRALGSTTTLNSIATTPSFPAGPEDPFWDDAVARVRERVRHEQEEERRERKASTKAEQKFIRNISKGREGHFKWAKLAIEALVGKYDEHGWLPKKDPKDFDDDDWKFVLEVLNHKDTSRLRDRLFQKPEWIEADKARKLRHEEAMKVNPTPEYLAAQKAQKDRERKEYGFRKVLGMLTEEELEREHLGRSPPSGLGISSDLGHTTPTTTHTDMSSKLTGLSSWSSSTPQTEGRGRQVKRPDLGTPGSLSLRHSVEQMTGVFNTEGFDPRLSRLGSDEIKQYIRDKSSTRSEPPTPTPIRHLGNNSLDPRQSTQTSSTHGSSLEAATGRQSPVVETISNDLPKACVPVNTRIPLSVVLNPTNPRRLSTLGVHPALRDSKIPRLRQAKSSITAETSDASRQLIAPRRSQPGLACDRPSKLGKPSSAVKASSEPASFRAFTAPLPPPPFSLAQGRQLKGPAKNAPLISKPSTTVKTVRSRGGLTDQAHPERHRGPSVKVAFNADLTQRAHPSQLPQSKSKADADLNEIDINRDDSEQRRTTFQGTTNDFGSVNKRTLNYKHNEQRRTTSLPLFQTNPKNLARLSRIPAFPDASDFSAAMDGDKNMSRDTTSSSLTSLAPRDRLAGKRSGIPVAIGTSTPAGQNAGHQNMLSNCSFASPTLSLPTTKVAGSTEEDAMMPPRASSDDALDVTGKWEVITPPATQQAETTSNEPAPSADEAACHRIEHVEDLTQLSPVRTQPAEQPSVPPEMSHDSQTPDRMPTTSSPGDDRSTNSSGPDVSFEDVINAWQQSSPVTPTQSRNTSFNNQEIQILRSEIGLEPIHEHIPGNPKHPNHHYTWNTKKVMCRRIHNPGIILPSLPSPTPGRPAHMAEYAAEFFVGSSYTTEVTEPTRCAACNSFCCQFAELSARPQNRTTDIIELNRLRRNAEAIATLRATKPNGVEEWEAFLKCSQCKGDFCPDCIRLCSEELCQEPVCSDCREGPELCRIHNMI